MRAIKGLALAILVFNSVGHVAQASDLGRSDFSTRQGPGLAAEPDIALEPGGPFDEAIREWDFPWIDPETGKLRPVVPARRPWLDWLGDRLDELGGALRRFFERFSFGSKSSPTVGSGTGELVYMGLFLAALVLFVIVLWNLWTLRGSFGLSGEAAKPAIGRGASVTDLPEGVRPGFGDPWTVAERSRASGDYGGAVVALFAFQLLGLDRRGLIRLTPGRTGRQYVQSVRDAGLARSPAATLTLFEEYYYGGKSPSRASFEEVWRLALDFKTRLDASGAGA